MGRKHLLTKAISITLIEFLLGLLNPPPARRLEDSSFVVALLRLRRSGDSRPSKAGAIRLAADELKR